LHDRHVANAVLKSRILPLMVLGTLSPEQFIGLLGTDTFESIGPRQDTACDEEAERMPVTISKPMNPQRLSRLNQST
jgi:hypothetical protein